MTYQGCKTRDSRTQILELLSSELLLFGCFVVKFSASYPMCSVGIVVFIFLARKSKFLVCKQLALVPTARNGRARTCARYV